MSISINLASWPKVYVSITLWLLCNELPFAVSLIRISDSFCSLIHPNKNEGLGIGVENFPGHIRSLFDYRKECKPRMPDCYSDQESQVPIISVYTISTEKGTLNGWLRVKITFNEPLQAFYLVGETDENFELETEEINPAKEGELNQAFGEFYASFPESNNCPRSDATNLQILPCGGLGRSDVFIFSGVMFVDHNAGSWSQTPRKTWKDVVYEDNHEKLEYNFYFRFSQYYCTLKRFYFRMFSLVAKPNSTAEAIRPSRTPFITPKLITNAYDPLPTLDSELKSLDCNGPLDKAPWVSAVSTEPMEFGAKETCNGNRDFKHLNNIGGIWFDTDNAYENEAGERIVPTLKSARCAKANEIMRTPPFGSKRFPEDIEMQWCQLVEKSPFRQIIDFEAIPIYENYLLNLIKKHSFKCQCRNQPTPEDPNNPPTGIPTKLTSTSTTMVTTRVTPEPLGPQGLSVQRGVRTDVGIGQLLWSSRVGHGCFFAIITVFITPVSLFMSRYYKETFMDTRILNFRVWSLVHIQSIPLTWVFIIAGLISISMGRMTLGRSLTDAASSHRILGWLIICLYLIMTFAGGIRCFRDCPRKVCICSHWLFGNLFYLGCLIVTIISLNIPGNPLSDEDSSFETPKGVTNDAIYLIISWIIFDVLMHCIMMTLMIQTDTEHEPPQRRLYLPVPIPVVREDNLIDTPNGNHRKIALVIYIVVAACFTYGLCQIMGSNGMKDNDPTRGFGPMTCTHLNLTTARQQLKESCRWRVKMPSDQNNVNKSSPEEDFYSQDSHHIIPRKITQVVF